MHRNDLQERFVSKHPGSKKHKRGKSLKQKYRDRRARVKEARQARVATERDVSLGNYVPRQSQAASGRAGSTREF